MWSRVSPIAAAVCWAYIAGCGAAAPAPTASADAGFVVVPGGAVTLGRQAYYPEEGPPSEALVSGFQLKTREVTNAEFDVFVRATGYVTQAEKSGGSAVFDAARASTAPMSWWRLEPTATWRSPSGAGSDWRSRAHHPVVHVTRADARAYAAWAGGRLPQEVEFEYAARRGLADPERSESGAFGEAGEHRANVFTGTFPNNNTATDGFAGTAPVGSFPADRLGAYDLIGNVWEWTDTPYVANPARATIKGGSHLCAEGHCRRYRPEARQGVEPDFSAAHLGFRIVRDLPQ